MEKNMLANFKKYKPLLLELVSRDIKNKYRRSVLGVLWTLLNPLFMMIILSIVFSHLFRGFNIDNYPLYILSGQVLYNFFSEATQGAMNSIIANAPLIKKVYVPKYMFALSRVVSFTINIFAAYAALLLVMIFTKAPMHYAMLLSFIPIVIMVILALGVGLFLAALAVQYRDIVHLYSVFLMGFIYLAPVIYPLDILPNAIQIIVKFNPVTNILTMFRGFMLYNTMPDLFTIIMSVVPSLLIFGLGVHVFKKKQDDFILYL